MIKGLWLVLAYKAGVYWCNVLFWSNFSNNIIILIFSTKIRDVATSKVNHKMSQLVDIF